ncbi:MAG: NUDIX hydrolase [Thermoanaerobaculia bacterium]
MERSSADSQEKLLYQGEHLSLKQTGSWEFVERRGKAGGVMVVAVTPEEDLLLVEEYRPPVGGHVISLPAGLVGDGGKAEDPAEAARRELCEETGYEAAALEFLGGGPSSPGLASERVSFFFARDVRKTGEPTAEESITLHLVPLPRVRSWAREREREGALIHPLLWAALYLAFPAAGAP